MMLLAYENIIILCSGYSTHNVPECVPLTGRNMYSEVKKRNN